jgi:hypothetical protein
MRVALAIIIALIAGCAGVPQDMPKPSAPPPPAPTCDYRVGGKCKHSSASDISGNTTLGNHTNEQQD